MDSIEYFLESTLLWYCFLFLIVALVVRTIYFLTAVMRGANRKNIKKISPLTTFGLSLFPYHKAVIKRPIYATLRFLFHICLIVVPIWLRGHIDLWEQSRFEWYWSSLPSELADWMTIVLLVLAAYFFIRRIVLPDVRRNSSASDFLLIIITALPFLTGYFYTNGTLDSVAFLGDNMLLFHVASAEVMLIAVAFLFLRTRLNKNKCTGCAACETNCPTGTLESTDQNKIRVFSYDRFQCICCGGCVYACPEQAAELRHELSLKALFQPFRREVVQSANLATCQECGTLFAPTLVLEKAEQTISDDYRDFCSSCTKKKLASNFYQLAPWPEK